MVQARRVGVGATKCDPARQITARDTQEPEIRHEEKVLLRKSVVLSPLVENVVDES